MAAPGQVLRAGAGAAAVQAADHGGGLRPLFPDRALLPRRGQPRRPQPGRVLPARPGDEIRRAGRRGQRKRAGAGGGMEERRVGKEGVRKRRTGGCTYPKKKKQSNKKSSSTR